MHTTFVLGLGLASVAAAAPQGWGGSGGFGGHQGGQGGQGWSGWQGGQGGSPPSGGEGSGGFQGWESAPVQSTTSAVVVPTTSATPVIVTSSAQGWENWSSVVRYCRRNGLKKLHFLLFRESQTNIISDRYHYTINYARYCEINDNVRCSMV